MARRGVPRGRTRLALSPSSPHSAIIEPCYMTTDTRKLFDENSNCWRTPQARRFGWLVDGEAYFAALRDAFGRAEREILIVGWDIDSRTQLIRNPEHPDYPSPLAETLETLVSDKPALRVHILSWDFSVIYMLEREVLPARSFGWQGDRKSVV